MNHDKIMALIRRATHYHFKPYIGGQVVHTNAQLKEDGLGRLTIFIDFMDNMQEVVVSVKDSDNVDFLVSVPIHYDASLPARFMTQFHRVLVLAAELVTYQEKP